MKTVKLLESLIDNGLVMTFFTKRQAQEYGRESGHRTFTVLRIERRFERVWIMIPPGEARSYGLFV